MLRRVKENHWLLCTKATEQGDGNGMEGTKQESQSNKHQAWEWVASLAG